MKTLQNNFTTPEQSKRLLELGVPADSADMVYMTVSGNSKVLSGQPTVLPDWALFKHYNLGNGNNVPCWSAGRLIEICLKCSTLEQRQVRFFCNGDDDEYSIIDFVINVLESGIMTNHNDFSKLEE